MTMKRFDLTQQHQDRLSDACNWKAYLGQGATGTFDVVARCAAVWVSIGAELGFDPTTRQAIAGEAVSAIMAQPTN